MLLDVSELEIDKIHLIVRDLRSHASVLPELVSLVEIGVDADLDEVEHRIKGVRAKVFLKVRLYNARHARPLPGHRGGARGDTRGPHQDELLTGTRGNAVRATENVLGDLDVCGTVDGALKGWLEAVQDTLREVLSQAGGKPKRREAPVRPSTRGPSSSAGEPSSEVPQKEKQG